MTTTLNLWQRIASAQKAVDYIQKEKKQGMNYSIVSHDAVTAKVRPVLVENGVLYYPVDIQSTQDGNRTQVKLTVRFVNVDKPEEHFDVPSLGYGIDSQDKGPGKAISYAVKYALLKTLGLETGDDPDQDQDATHIPQRPIDPRTPINSNGTPAQPLKRDEARALFKTLQGLLVTCNTDGEVMQFEHDNGPQIELLGDWKVHIDNAITQHRAAIADAQGKAA